MQEISVSVTIICIAKVLEELAPYQEQLSVAAATAVKVLESRAVDRFLQQVTFYGIYEVHKLTGITPCSHA